jgi:hypothetical protein
MVSSSLVIQLAHGTDRSKTATLRCTDLNLMSMSLWFVCGLEVLLDNDFNEPFFKLRHVKQKPNSPYRGLGVSGGDDSDTQVCRVLRKPSAT